jgi:hypothetical protein
MWPQGQPFPEDSGEFDPSGGPTSQVACDVLAWVCASLQGEHIMRLAFLLLGRQAAAAMYKIMPQTLVLMLMPALALLLLHFITSTGGD